MPEPSASQRPDQPNFSRRSLLTGSLAVAATGGLTGCQRSQPAASDSAPLRHDVPLRIDWMGTDAEASALKRAWGSVSSQPLEVHVQPTERDRSAGLTDRLIETAGRRDVLVYPVAAMAALSSADAIIPLSEEEQQSIDEAHGSLFPALRNGAASYAGEVTCLPLGGRVPALLAVDPTPQLPSWADYDRWVNSIDGAAGEPLAGGWAGTMFLWRAAATLRRGWLFDRQTLQPVVDSEPYVAVLRQMKKTASRYRDGRQTPEQIWAKLASGKLRGGIGFPAGTAPAAAAIYIADLPAPADTHTLMLDPFSPVASLSVGCRQSVAAKRFLKWLAGGENSQAVRRHVAAMTLTREPPIDLVERPDRSAAARVGEQDSPSDYQSWLRRRLATALTRPNLQLLGAGEYYAALDDQVGRCLDGEASPEEALAGVAQQWQEITGRAGMEKQRRCWMRAQGMRARA